MRQSLFQRFNMGEKGFETMDKERHNDISLVFIVVSRNDIKQEHLDHECPTKEKQIRPRHSHKTLPSTQKNLQQKYHGPEQQTQLKAHTSILQPPSTPALQDNLSPNPSPSLAATYIDTKCISNMRLPSSLKSLYRQNLDAQSVNAQPLPVS